MANVYKMYPNPAQERVMIRHCGEARFIYNLCLEQFNYYWKGSNPPDFNDRSLQLTELRKELPWLREGSASIQQQAINNFNNGCVNWWKGTHGRPKFKKRYDKDSFCIRDVKVEKLNKKWMQISVPKVGYVKFKLSRALPKNYGMAHVSRTKAGEWRVSFTAEPEAILREPTGKAIGIDRGVITTLATSDKQFLRIPQMSKRDQERLLKLEQQFSRQSKHATQVIKKLKDGEPKPFFVNKEKTRKKIAKLQGKYVARRRDWIEKQTTHLVIENDIIAAEKLMIQNMTKAPKPKLAEDGKTYLPNGAAAKAGLNKAILTVGASYD